MTSTVWSQNVWSNLSTRRSQKGRRLGVLLPVRKKESAEDSPASEGSFPLKSWRFSSLFFCAAGCVVFFGHRNLRTQKKTALGDLSQKIREKNGETTTSLSRNISHIPN